MKFDCKYDEMLDIEKIVRHPRNNNMHPIEQIEAFERIIEKKGVWRVPLIISKKSGYLVSGHCRLTVAENLRLEKLPVVYQDFENEADEYQFLTFDNEIARWAELNRHEVHLALEEIEGLEIDDLGIKDWNLKTEYQEIEGEDDAPAIDETKTITSLGDVWILGNHRVMCGDSTVVTDVEKLMDGQKADMVFTDPPYGYSYKSNYQNKHEMLENDDKILDFLPLCNGFMADNATMYLCTSYQVVDKWKNLIEDNFNFKNLIVWKKNNWSMGDLTGAFACQHEIVLFASKGKNKIIGKRDSDVWQFDRVPPKLHPTMKPVQMIEYAMSKWQSGQVMDLFLGSGSTLIACEKTNRKCYGMELDPKYVDVIIKRWQEFTGKHAILESTGQRFDDFDDEKLNNALKR